MCSAITMLAERIGTDPLPWNPSAHELDTMYKAVEALRLSVLNLLRIKADAVMSELTAKERDDANETA